MKDGIPSRVADAAVRVDTPPNARPYPYALSMTNVVVSIVWLRFNAALSQPDVNPIAQPNFQFPSILWHLRVRVKFVNSAADNATQRFIVFTVECLNLSLAAPSLFLGQKPTAFAKN